jgi:hypothetical protein
LGIKINPAVPVERIGSDYGGWIIPAGFFNPQSICYLVGAGEDISFDLGLAYKFGCTAHIFDPTPRALAHLEKTIACIRASRPMPCSTCPDGFYPGYPVELAARLQVHPVGIWDTDTTLQFFAPEKEEHVSHSLVNLQHSGRAIEVPVRQLASVMKELGHSQIDLLKIDTEGAEYQILESIIQDDLDVRVLCVEYDETAANHLDRHYLSRIRASLTRLQNAGFMVIAKEPDCRNFTLLHTRYFDQRLA